MPRRFFSGSAGRSPVEHTFKVRCVGLYAARCVEASKADAVQRLMIINISHKEYIGDRNDIPSSGCAGCV